jgi:hypothetical protein
MSKLGPTDWMAVKIIMRYLNCTLSTRLRSAGKHINLKCYSDADCDKS